MLATPSLAFGANRYAAPTPQGTANCSSPANACDLQTALNGATSGDIAIALPGTYILTTYLNTPAGVSLAGQPGARPVIAMSGFSSLGTFTANGTTLVSVSNLDLEASASSSFLITAGAGATLTHLVVNLQSVTSDVYAVQADSGSTVSDSLVRSASPATGAVAAQANGSSSPTKLINDTAYATGSGGVGVDVISSCFVTPAQANATLQNVIAHGSGGGIRTTGLNFGCSPPTSLASVSYSNYNGVNASNGPVTDAGHNQTDPASTDPNALFVSPGSDFHERTGAPTIDAARNSGLEPTDLDGNPRVQGSAPDMGAYEIAPPTPPPGGGGGSTVHCVVPKLKGKTLKQARKALRKAHCKLGKVKRPKHSRHKRLVVLRLSAKPGTVLANGAKVGVKLKVKRHKHK